MVTPPIPRWEQSGGENCYVTWKTKIGASEVLSKRQAVRFGWCLQEVYYLFKCSALREALQKLSTFLISCGVKDGWADFFLIPWNRSKFEKKGQRIKFSVILVMGGASRLSAGRLLLDATPGTLTSWVWVSNCDASVWTRLVLKCVSSSEY